MTCYFLFDIDNLMKRNYFGKLHQFNHKTCMFPPIFFFYITFCNRLKKQKSNHYNKCFVNLKMSYQCAQTAFVNQTFICQKQCLIYKDFHKKKCHTERFFFFKQKCSPELVVFLPMNDTTISQHIHSSKTHKRKHENVSIVSPSAWLCRALHFRQ